MQAVVGDRPECERGGGWSVVVVGYYDVQRRPERGGEGGGNGNTSTGDRDDHGPIERAVTQEPCQAQARVAPVGERANRRNDLRRGAGRNDRARPADLRGPLIARSAGVGRWHSQPRPDLVSAKA